MARATEPEATIRLTNCRDRIIRFLRSLDGKSKHGSFFRLLSGGPDTVPLINPSRFRRGESMGTMVELPRTTWQYWYIRLRFSFALAEFRPKRRIEVNRHAAEPRQSAWLWWKRELARLLTCRILKKFGVRPRAVHFQRSAGQELSGDSRGSLCHDYVEILKDPESGNRDRKPNQHTPRRLSCIEGGRARLRGKADGTPAEGVPRLFRVVGELESSSPWDSTAAGADAPGAETTTLSSETVQPYSTSINSPAFSGSYWMADPASGGTILVNISLRSIDVLAARFQPVEISAYPLPTDKKDRSETILFLLLSFCRWGSITNLTYSTVEAGRRPETRGSFRQRRRSFRRGFEAIRFFDPG